MAKLKNKFNYLLAGLFSIFNIATMSELQAADSEDSPKAAGDKAQESSSVSMLVPAAMPLAKVLLLF